MSMTQEAREQRIKDALEAYAQEETPERIPLPFRDQAGKTFAVVSLPLKAVLLNPRSHRIKAHLESHPDRDEVQKDPYSDKAQAIIAHVLRVAGDRGLENFELLKKDLEEIGQRDAGVITHSGVLINANTRAVAMRELDPNGYIRVAVLPSDADERDIDQLEMRLQIQREFRRDYSFSNLLIFVHDLLETYGYSEDQVARQLNYAASTDDKEMAKGVNQVRRLVRQLTLLRDLQKRSGGTLPLTFFDDKKQALDDLDQQFEAMVKKGERAAAERMREGRLLGILAGCGYENLRKITGTAVTEHLVPRIEKAAPIKDALPAITAPSKPTSEAEEDDDVTLLAGGAPAAPAPDGSPIKPLVTFLAKAVTKPTVTLPQRNGSAEEVETRPLLDQIGNIVDDAADVASVDASLKQKTDGPIRYLGKATTQLRSAIDAYRSVGARSDFDQAAWEHELSEFRTAVEALEAEIKKGKQQTAQTT